MLLKMCYINKFAFCLEIGQQSWGGGELLCQIRKIPLNTNQFATIILSCQDNDINSLLLQQKLAKLTK